MDKAQEKLENLKEFVEEIGGDFDLSQWRCDAKERKGSEHVDYYFIAIDSDLVENSLGGKKRFRSKKELGRALGLLEDAEGRPSSSKKTDGKLKPKSSLTGETLVFGNFATSSDAFFLSSTKKGWRPLGTSLWLLKDLSLPVRPKHLKGKSAKLREGSSWETVSVKSASKLGAVFVTSAGKEIEVPRADISKRVLVV